MNFRKTIGLDGWTMALESRRYREFVPGTLYARFGVAVLFYRPVRRLSVSLWGFGHSTNIRLWGQRTLSCQR